MVCQLYYLDGPYYIFFHSKLIPWKMLSQRWWCWVATWDRPPHILLPPTPVISSAVPGNPSLPSPCIRRLCTKKLSTCIMLIIIFTHIQSTLPCKLGGIDIGVCDTSLEEDRKAMLSVMPFCGQRIFYTPCVPRYNPLAPSRDYPDGRWFKNTIKTKDD